MTARTCVACHWPVVDRGDGVARCAGCGRPEERCDAGGTWACLSAGRRDIPTTVEFIRRRRRWSSSADDDERTGA